MSHERNLRAPLAAAVLFFLLLIPAGVTCQSQAPATSPAADAANELFLAKKWPEAATAYSEIVKAAPTDGRSWYRLGTSLLALKRFELAASAFEKAAAIGQQPAPMYGAGAAYAQLAKPEKAFEWLRKAADAGYPQTDQFKADENFAPLRTDARFTEIAQAFAVNASPCQELPRYRDFDFFVGEWEVRGQGTNAATNSIQSISGKCILFENYTNGPYSGKSFSYYDASIGKWRQTWVDAFGGSATFVGEYHDGVMRFEGESHPRTGPATKIRMTFFNQGPDRLRQLGETTSDEGKTWTITYDLAYTRKK